LNGCDGTQNSIVTSQKCSVLISYLLAPPFSLPWGSSINAIVTAINIVGTSLNSQPGNGAVILTIPDSPVNFLNNPAVTSAT
jgi:hypothetical protein